ncbi:choline kinase [Moniliophthora roreri MCA 2997]|uniref:Choline kinase n=1 Tax=Moniliophthora roreri (strain MCA 2997) TaxID=1381753 RepID=V2Y163_MONRO|nr:choline kinase [Moniliophthora roreri MCA 2997]
MSPALPTLAMSPIISPSLSGPPLGLENRPLIRRVSTSSVKSIASAIVASASSSVVSLPAAGDVEVVKEEGLKHADITLEARQYTKAPFLQKLLDCIRTLKISSWLNQNIVPQDVKVDKVSGSLTNAVFFVSCPTTPEAKTLLLRIYGPSSGEMISRPRELHTLHILSSQYGLGPRVYGTFENGRIEEYFDSKALTASDMRNPQISRWIGARMAELHSVDVEVIEETSAETRGEGKGWEISAKKNVKAWLGPAKEVLQLPALSQADREELDLDKFKQDWDRYMKWLASVDDVTNASRRVFAHNDAQYGNLLRLTKVKDGLAPHRQIIVVDFEYASPNPATFDIANHFHEWTANYHSSTPHLLDPSRYPTPSERRNFYASYLEHAHKGAPLTDAELTAQLDKLDEQIRYWSPSSHAMWAVWGIVQARDDLQNDVKEPEFDYIGYAKCRMASFRREIAALL